MTSANVTAQSVLVFQDGSCEKTALFSIKNTTAGDTLDLASWFSVVKRAGVVSATGTTVGAVEDAAAGANGGPTLLTIPAGPAQDGLWLIAVGVAA
jgi:hypothetical protein